MADRVSQAAAAQQADGVSARPGVAVQPGVPLCASDALTEGGLGVPFEVRWAGQDCAAFAIRYAGRVYAYLNRCAHVPMEMDYQPNQFFDTTGHRLICATHGALYDPTSGRCLGGRCRSGLQAVRLSEADGQVCWHPDAHVQPLDAPR